MDTEKRRTYREWYAKNKELKQKYYCANRERIREQQKRYYNEHRDDILARKRQLRC